MERVIKIQSANSMTQSFTGQGQAAVGLINNVTNKNCDFKIPEGGVYDLSKSYMAFEFEITSETAAIAGAKPVAKLGMGLLSDNTGFFHNSHMNQSSGLIRNCQLYSQRRGMLESIRRVDTLSYLKFGLENDHQEIQRNMDTLGELQTQLEQNVYRSKYLDEVRLNGPLNGSLDPGVTLSGPATSHQRPHEQKIPLSSVFGIGKANRYDTTKYGETRINLELNLDKLVAVYLQGNEGNGNRGQNAVSFQAVDNQAGVAANTAINTVVFTMTYDDPENEFPFHIGQKGVLGATGNVGGATTVNAIIQQANYDPTTKKVTVKFNTTVFTAQAGGVENFTLITFVPEGTAATVPVITLRNAELNLVEVMDGKATPDEISYITYSTEEMNSVNLSVANKNTHLEPNAQTLYVALCDAGQLAPNRLFSKYRMAIDNVDVSQQRDINYGRGIHKDRLIRAYRNKGVPLKNLILRMYRMSGADNDLDIDTTILEPLSVIVEPLELKNEEKQLQLEIDGGGTNVNDIILYKELVVTK